MKKILLFLVLLAIVGCKEKSGTVPVQGIVKLDGQPLKDAAVQFVPQGTGRDATATTDANGKFVMSTFEPRDGAMPGSYKVVITSLGNVEATPTNVSADQAMAAASAAAAKAKANAGSQVPVAYTRLDKTPLKQDVPAIGEIVFDIKSK